MQGINVSVRAFITNRLALERIDCDIATQARKGAPAPLNGASGCGKVADA
jgi:hypothetical protein